jgi:ribosomal protein L11 methyltransferase
LSNTSWLEVSLIVDGEAAEAVAEVLARFAPDGVAIESTAVVSSPDDAEGHAVGPLRVCAYLPAEAGLEDTRQKLEEALWYLGCIRPLPAAQYRTVQETDWSEAWKEHYNPIPVGERLIIVPAWLESPDSGRIPVRMDPGMAFGTGTHPTTQLCLEILDEWLLEKASSGDELAAIDVGCGSGILSIAALKLGARRALGVDIDADAVAAAKSNAALNGVGERLEVGLGSVAEVRAGTFSLTQAPLVLANILAPVIVSLLGGGLVELLTPGGMLVLSGILAEQAGDVESALQRHGLQAVIRRQSGDWIAFGAELSS